VASAVSALCLATLSGPVIVGGGPAGAGAAIALARAGHVATLIERNVCATDKVCGDFLSAEAVAVLEELGVDLSAASTITCLRLVHKNRAAVAELPFVARGLSRRALDEALLGVARAAGAEVLRGHRVAGFAQDRGRMWLDCGALGRIAADTVFLATGKHELRGAARTHRGGKGLVGLKMYYQLAASQVSALRCQVELILLAEGYAGLQLVEADRAVLCVLLPAARLRAVDGHWHNLLDSLTDESPDLRQRLTGASALLDRPLAVAGLPYGYIHSPTRSDPPGLFRVGDQAAVIGSITGDGVALALSSGLLATRSWVAGCTGARYHRLLARSLSRQMRLASAIHRLCLAPAWQPYAVTVGRLWPQVVRLAAVATRAKRLTHSGYAA
jgi:flavin-dependent dehydrogenase